MSTRPDVPAPEAVEAHYVHSAERRRSGRRMIWGILIGFVLLLMLTPLVLYLAWQARGRALLRDELAKITARGEPITTAEMAAWYAVPKDERDITAIWVAAIKPFDTPAFSATGAALPIVGNGPALPPLDQPLPAADEQAIRDFLLLHQDAIAAVYAAAQEQGEVRFARDFRQGIGMLLPEAQQMRGVVRVLDLEFEVLAREKDLTAAFENLRTRLVAGETLRHEPLLISMLVRVAVQHLTIEDIRRLADTGRLSDAELARLQAMIRPIDIHGQMAKAMLGERAWCYHAFHQNMGFAMTANFDGTGNVARDTSHDVRDVKRPEDCAMALSLLGEMEEAAQGPPSTTLAKMNDFDARLKALHGETMSLNRLRYAMTSMLLPAIQAVSVADARGESMRDLTDCSLAVRRFHLKHGRAPAALDELVPDFLSKVPLDSYNGQPLRYIQHSATIVIYSVGKDLRDDGGQTDPGTHEPDVAVEIKLPQ